MPTSKWFVALALAGAIAVAGCGSDVDNEEGMADEGEAPAGMVEETTDVAPPPAAQSSAPQVDPSTLPEGVTQAMIDAGQTIFTQTGFCFTCHGQDGTGSQLAPNLTDDEWLHATDGDYELIVQTITDGVPQPIQFTASQMPPMGGAQLTDEQVREVAAYVWSLSHGG